MGYVLLGGLFCSLLVVPLSGSSSSNLAARPGSPAIDSALRAYPKRHADYTIKNMLG